MKQYEGVLQIKCWVKEDLQNSTYYEFIYIKLKKQAKWCQKTGLITLGEGKKRETRRGYKVSFWGANDPFVDFGAGYITVFTL